MPRAMNRDRHLPTVALVTCNSSATWVLAFSHTVRAAQDDARAHCQPLRRLAPPRPALECLPVLGTDRERSLGTTSGGTHTGALRVAG